MYLYETNSQKKLEIETDFKDGKREPESDVGRTRGKFGRKEGNFWVWFWGWFCVVWDIESSDDEFVISDSGVELIVAPFFCLILDIEV